jgi:hypothetical protein
VRNFRRDRAACADRKHCRPGWPSEVPMTSSTRFDTPSFRPHALDHSRTLPQGDGRARPGSQAAHAREQAAPATAVGECAPASETLCCPRASLVFKTSAADHYRN